jgi:hypothetical protein
MRTAFALVIVLLVMTSCSKDELIGTPEFVYMTPEELYKSEIEPRMQREAILTMDEDRCTRRIENLDSLIFSDNYWLWIEDDNGSVTYFEEGQVPRVRATNALMRCGVFGYGGAMMRLDTWDESEAMQVGVLHWPFASVVGINIIEVFHVASGKSWMLRSNTSTGQWLAFTSAINGNANEGAQTGSATAYLKNPDDQYLEVSQNNTIGFTLTLYDAEGTTSVDENSYTDYGRILWKNGQTDNGIDDDGWDYFQPCSVQNMMIRVDLQAEGIVIQSNWYSFIMRSQYQSDNTCFGSNDYQFTNDDPEIGEFKFY